MAKILALILGIWASLFGGNNKVISPLPKYKLQAITPTAVQIIVKPETKNLKQETTSKIGDTMPWGVAVQVDEHTWTMKVGEDKRMATSKEIHEALNNYRKIKGASQLMWDDNLANYAQSRADYLFSIKTTDGHKGFADFLENQNGYDKLGFTWLGENISYGYQVEGVHLIEWLYAGDKDHDANQLNSRWNYVGVGVRGTATCLIFGTGRR